MPLVILQAPVTADVGDTWRAFVAVLDLDGVSATPDGIAATVTDPAGTDTAATVTAMTPVGLYLVTHDVAMAGDHLVEVAVTDATFGDDVEVLRVAALATDDTGTFDDAEVITYLGDTTSADAAAVADALAAERAAQRNVCRIPVPYPADLAQALKRRVARNLAARAVPVASFTAFEGGTTSSRVPQRDPEVTRLEGPYRRLPRA